MWVKGVAKSMAPLTVAPKTVATGTATRITDAPIEENAGADQGVLVQADPGNSGTVYIGSSGVTTSSGIALSAGSSLNVPVFDPYSVYAIGSAAAQILRIFLV